MTRHPILLTLGLLVLVTAGFVAVARLTTRTIDGIGCDPLEQARYHVHAYLAIVDRGRPHYPPAGVGIHPEHLCLYWLHTHRDSGIIHIESPQRFVPTLGTFFDVWGQPLSRRQVWTFRVGPGERMRVRVDGKAYTGDPRNIPLRSYTTVAIEIGPPFAPPPPPDFLAG